MNTATTGHIETVTYNFRDPDKDKPSLSVSEKQLIATYVQGTTERDNFEQTITGVDRSMTVQAFITSDDYRPYVPSLFLTDFLGRLSKRENKGRIICPNSRSVDRNEFYWRQALGPFREWQIIKPGTAPKDSTQKYFKQRGELLKRGWAASFEREELSDSPLSELEDRQAFATQQIARVEEFWITAELDHKTSDTTTAYDEKNDKTTYRDLYSNTTEALGTRVAKTNADGSTDTGIIPISAEDILTGIEDMRKGNDIDPTKLGYKGEDFYIPTLLVVSISTYRNLVKEIFRSGFAATNNQLAQTNQAESIRNTGMLQDYFGIPVMVAQLKKYTDHGDSEFETDTVNASNPAYLLDQNWITWIEHSEGAVSQQWITEANELVHIQTTKRYAPLVLDPNGIRKILPAAA